MPHGQRDFGMYAVKETIGSDADNAELAARLNSIVTFDRRGDVLYLDDFESGITKWATGGTGVAWAVDWSAVKARNGGFCCELTTDVGVGDNVRIGRNFSYPRLSPLGAEFSFNQIGNISSIRAYIELDDGANLNQAAFRYDPPLGEVYILDRTAGWVPLQVGLMLSESANRFHTVKLVNDFATSRYVRLILNNLEWSLNQYTTQQGVTAVPGEFSVQIWVYNEVAGAHKAWVDDVIVTQNEP